VYQGLLKRGLVSSVAFTETSFFTKTPLSTIRDVVLKPLHARKQRADKGNLRKVDEGDKDLIRRKIYAMYQENLVPTIRSLKARLTLDDTNISVSITSLWRIVSQMGFKYKRINKRQVLMESQRLQKWRYEYITKIREYRLLSRSIIYPDETWFDTHETPSKRWSDLSDRCQSKAPSNKWKRITILHAGSKDGWIPNALLLSAKNIKDSSLDYHEDTTAELLEDWFKTKLLPNIPPNSVIVMDNASYHSRQIKKVPNSANTKSDIQKYMLENDIFFEDSYKKNELLDVLKAFNLKKEYVCDAMAENSGHTVLRLPPYYCVFNPIEFMWHKLKTKIRSENVTPTLSKSVIDLIRKIINSNDDMESWKNSTEHVFKVENSYLSVQNNIEPIVINLSEDSDSETELLDV
jgi:transposase